MNPFYLVFGVLLIFVGVDSYATNIIPAELLPFAVLALAAILLLVLLWAAFTTQTARPVAVIEKLFHIVVISAVGLGGFFDILSLVSIYSIVGQIILVVDGILFFAASFKRTESSLPARY